MDKQRLIARVAFFAAILAFVVVGLGAYTRLTNSGLGCPDWPGCYGQLMVPSQQHELAEAQQAFPQQVVEPAKAWKEMIHRYVAGSLGLLMVLLAGLMVIRHRSQRMLLFPVLLLGLLVFQAALGMWTVTWQLLPLVVMGHLLGGFLILSLLWLLWLRMRDTRSLAKMAGLHRFRPWALLAMVMVFLQIALGGWTSANYAALACPDFPFCNGAWLPQLNLHDAFNLFAPIGHNYEGGHLDGVGRVTIQFVHRIGALLTFLYVGSLAVVLLLTVHLRAVRRLAGFILLLLTTQVILGIINAMQLPVLVAVGHNLVAATLLLALITVNYQLFTRATVAERGVNYG